MKLGIYQRKKLLTWLGNNDLRPQELLQILPEHPLQNEPRKVDQVLVVGHKVPLTGGLFVVTAHLGQYELPDKLGHVSPVEVEQELVVGHGFLDPEHVLDERDEGLQVEEGPEVGALEAGQPLVRSVVDGDLKDHRTPI